MMYKMKGERMKKQFKHLAAFAAAMMMTALLAITAYAETTIAVEGVKVPLSTVNRNTHEAMIGQFTFSKTPIPGKPLLESEVPLEEVAGYEWKRVYMYFDDDDTGFTYARDIDNAKDWGQQLIESDLGLSHGPYHVQNFTITSNNIDYTQCMYINAEYRDKGGMFYFFRVPIGFTGKINFIVHPTKYEDGKRVSIKSSEIVFQLNDGVPPMPWVTPGWQQDAFGWRVLNPDGSYVVNSWYQSPESGMWYYMGADGYMLTNTSTPDGLWVNEDGVRVP